MSHGPVVAAAEAIAISLTRLGWKMRVAVFVAIVDVGGAVVFIVTSCAFKAVVKALALNVIELVGEGIPLRRRRRRLRWGEAGLAAGHQMLHRATVASAKSIAIRVAHLRRDMGMAKLIAVFDVGPAVIVDVASRALDAVMKTLTLDLVELLGSDIPAIAGRRRALGAECGGEG